MQNKYNLTHCPSISAEANPSKTYKVTSLLQKQRSKSFCMFFTESHVHYPKNPENEESQSARALLLCGKQDVVANRAMGQP